MQRLNKKKKVYVTELYIAYTIIELMRYCAPMFAKNKLAEVTLSSSIVENPKPE